MMRQKHLTTFQTVVSNIRLGICLVFLIGFLEGCGENSGEIWQSVGNTAVSAGATVDESLIFYKRKLYLAYQDGEKGNRVTVREFDGHSWVSVGPEGFSPTGITTFVSLSVDPDDGTLYVAYVLSQLSVIRGSQDPPTTSLSSRIFVQKYNGKEWVTVGGKAIGEGGSPSLAVGKGVPYVSYIVDQTKIVCSKYNGRSWVRLGNVPIEGKPFTWGGLCVDQATGHVFMGFLDNKTNRIIVAGFDGKNWGAVGDTGVMGAANGSLWLDQSGIYLAYQDTMLGKKAGVMRYDGVSWKPVGKIGFSGGGIDTMSFLIDRGVPYAAFRDVDHTGRVTVMRYRDGDWHVVGTRGFSQGPAGYESLALDPVNHTLFLAFNDVANGKKAAVMGCSLPRP